MRQLFIIHPTALRAGTADAMQLATANASPVPASMPGAITGSTPAWDQAVKRLSSHGYRLFPFPNGRGAIENLHLNPEAVIVAGEPDDLMVGEILRLVHAYDRSIDVLVVDDTGELDRKVELLRDGAWDVLDGQSDFCDALTDSLEQAGAQRKRRFQPLGPLFGNPEFREAERQRYMSDHLPYPPIKPWRA